MMFFKLFYFVNICEKQSSANRPWIAQKLWMQFEVKTLFVCLFVCLKLHALIEKAVPKLWQRFAKAAGKPQFS